VRVLFRSATQGIHRDIYLLTSPNRGASFEGRKLHEWNINACPMSSMSFAESAGHILGAWETAGQAYFEDLTAPNAAPVPAPGNGKLRKHPRLTTTRGGETLMVWAQGAGWQHSGSLAWQLFDGSGNAVGETRIGPNLPDWSFGAVIAAPSGFVIFY
jgi:hypothetical protein